MMRRRLTGGDVLVVLKKLDLLRGRDMQYMDARPRHARNAHQPVGAAQRRHVIAPDRMRGRIVLDTL